MIARPAAALLALTLLAGCPGPWHTHDLVEVRLRSASARSVNVRLFLLQDEERFLATSPADLAANGEAFKEITMTPGRSEPTPVNLGERPPQVKAVGILALYDGTRAAGETWHAAVRIDDLDAVVVELRDRTLRIVSR